MKQLSFISFFLLVFATNKLYSIPVASSSSGYWDVPSTWSGGVVPSTADVVTISNGHTVIVRANASCASVTIGNAALNFSTTLTIISSITLTVSGNITIIPPSSGTTDNRMDVNAGTVFCSSLITINATNNARRCIVNIGMGELTCAGDFAMGTNATRNKLVFSGSGILRIGGTASTIANGQFTASTGTIDYNGSVNQSILLLTYYSLSCSGSGIKSLNANTTLKGNLTIAGTAQLDVTSANRNIAIAGNWIVTSTHADPFIEQAARVTFNGTAGIQTLSTVAAQENFYNLTINNTSGNSPAVEFNSNCSVAQTYTHTAEIVDLKGKSLLVSSLNNTGAFITCSLSGGSIISSLPDAQIAFSDANDSTYVNIDGFSIGDNSNSIALTINTGRINIEYSTFYGAGNFTKTFPIDDATAKGGNKYHGDVTFTAATSASRWRMSTGNGSLPDSFFAKASFNAYANGGSNNNFIVGANSVGNYYADSVWLTSTTVGGLYVGRQNGALSGTSSSHYFNGHVEVMVTYTGNISFADGKDTLPSTVVFNKTLKLNSTNTSTGDIYVGKNTAGSSINFTTTGQLTDGSITGATNIYFYNVTQTGFFLQATTNAGSSNSTIEIGSSTSPCTWNGPVAFTAPNINLAYSIFNGFINIFTMNGASTNQNCTGGNTFAGNTHNLFTNSGSVNWYLANAAPDTYNGNTYFSQLSTGLLRPSYNTNCTYAGNIYIQSGSDSIAFAAGANGRVTINGSSSTVFDNGTLKGTTIKRLTINKTSGNFSLYKGINIPTAGDLSLVSGKIITTAARILRLLNENCTVTATTAASGSYVDGPMQYDVTNNAPQSLHFPIGKGNDCRPVQLDITHSTNTSYSYAAEVFNASAQALGWTLPSPVTNVSTAHYWDVERYNTSTGDADPSTDLSGNQTIGLHYGANDNVTDVFILSICKNTATAPTTWSNIGATGATVTSGSVSSTSSPDAFNSFSRFTLAYSGTPPPPPVGTDSSRCGTGSVTLIATPVNDEEIDWYSTATGGTALATNTDTFNTPSIAVTTIYYAESRNIDGFVSSTRTPVTATVYPAVSITSFTPTSGSLGSSVVITGSNFNTVTAVSFGGTPAVSYTIDSDTQITATVAPTVSGSVALTNSCGTDSLGGFSFLYITVWTGANDNTWTDAGNWDNGVPNNLFTTVIDNVSNIPLISSDQAVKTLTVIPGAGLDIAVGNTLSVIDSLTNDGNVTGDGSILLDGSSLQPVSGTGTLNNLILNNNSGAEISNISGTMVNVTGRITPTAGTLFTNGNLTLKSDLNETAAIGTGAAAGGYINGTVMLERFIPARRAWRLISFPIIAAGAPTINEAMQENAGGNASSNPSPGYGLHITGGSVANGFDQNPVNNISMKQFSGGSLVAISSTNQAISNSNAYFLFVRGSRANNLALLTNAPADNTTLRVKGNVVQGNQSISITGTGWKLIANPFPSRINLDAIAVNNSSLINRNFTFWDPKIGGTNNVGGYITASYNGSSYDYTPTPVSSLSQYAQPFAALYVDAIAAGDLLVNETNKCNCGNDNVFRPAGLQTKMRINLHSYNTDGTTPVVDGVIAAFDEKYSNKTDRLDAEKLPAVIAESLSILSADHSLAIERRKKIIGADTIQLNISNMIRRRYQLELKPENFNVAGLTAFVEDRFTKTTTPLNLLEGNRLDFSITADTASAASTRFRIIFKTTSKIAPVVNTRGGIQLIQNPVTNNMILLEMTGQIKGEYNVVLFDSRGVQLMTTGIDHDGVDGIKTILIKNHLSKGIYHLSLKDRQHINTTFKILIQ